MGHKLSRLWRQRSERKAHCVTSDQNGHLPTSAHELNPPHEAGPTKNHMQSDDISPLNAYDDPYAGLSECSMPPPVQNRDDSATIYSHQTLDDNMREQSTRQHS